jgi:hypothetical protein
LIALAAFTITGWYYCTRGEEKTLPDGSVEKTGMIFKGWYFFWMKKTGIKRIHYKYQPLSNLIAEIVLNYPQYNYLVNEEFINTNAPKSI